MPRIEVMVRYIQDDDSEASRASFSIQPSLVLDLSGLTPEGLVRYFGQVFCQSAFSRPGIRSLPNGAERNVSNLVVTATPGQQVDTTSEIPIFPLEYEGHPVPLSNSDVMEQARRLAADPIRGRLQHAMIPDDRSKIPSRYHRKPVI